MQHCASIKYNRHTPLNEVNKNAVRTAVEQWLENGNLCLENNLVIEIDSYDSRLSPDMEMICRISEVSTRRV